jgi:hypothetical protein
MNGYTHPADVYRFRRKVNMARCGQWQHWVVTTRPARKGLTQHPHLAFG